MGFNIVFVGGGVNGSCGFRAGLLGLMSVRGCLGFFFFFFVFYCLASVLVCFFYPPNTNKKEKREQGITQKN